MCRTQVCVRHKCVLDTSACWVQVCVGSKCVSDTSLCSINVCQGQVSVGDLSSGVQLCLMQSEVGFLFVAF